MAYIGSSAALVPVSFSTPDSQAFNGNDSSTVFTLSRPIVTTTQLEIIVNNVQQSPYDGSYSVSGTTLTFSEAPSTGTANVYVNYRDQAIGTITDETRVAKTGDTMSGTLIINGELFVNSNDINLDDLQSLTWGDGSVQVRGNGTAETLELRTSAATRVFVDSSGNVGIGTSSPDARLHIAGTVATGRPAVYLENTTASTGRTYYLGANNGGTLSIHDLTADSERLRIDASGNVGIGTSSPAYRLDVSATGFIAARVSTSYSGTGNIRIEDATTTANAPYIGSVGDDLAFGRIGVAEYARIDTDGNLLVGKTSDASAVNTQGINLRDTGQIVAHTGSGNAPLYVCRDNTGDGIIFYRDGASKGKVVINTSSVSYNTTSDYRLKENVVGLGNASSRVLQLNPVRFNFIGDSDTVDGFLAHEAKPVVPEAVSGEKDAVDAEGNPEYQGIDQSKLVPLLTAALQEALAKIDDLTARVSALETA